MDNNDNKQKSYDYFAQAIFAAMIRRKLIKINGRKIPNEYKNSQEIFDLLDYQNRIPFRLVKKMKVFLQNRTFF